MVLGIDPESIKWKFSDAIIASILLFPLFMLIFYPVFLVLKVSSLHLFASGGSISTVDLVISYAIQSIVMIGLIWFFVFFKRKSNLSDLGFQPANPLKTLLISVSSFILIIFANFIYGIVVFLLSKYIGFDIPDSKILGLLLKGDISIYVLIPIVVVIAPIIEESFFRGFIYAGLIKRVPRWAGIIISAALFAVFHLEPYQIAPLLFIGFVLTFVYDRTKSLVAPIIIHSLNNIFYVIIFYYIFTR
ncbi:MAG: CPBP family intramembrane metalloprotease [Actinobacteria bacterium]|nr:CPBP family intramembrane metalloprotease [Actinomycetota bacterium]